MLTSFFCTDLLLHQNQPVARKILEDLDRATKDTSVAVQDVYHHPPPITKAKQSQLKHQMPLHIPELHAQFDALNHSQVTWCETPHPLGSQVFPERRSCH